MKVNEIKVIIRKNYASTHMSLGYPYEFDKDGVVTRLEIPMPSTRLDRICDMIYSTKFKDGSTGPILCGYPTEDNVFHVIGFCYLPDKDKKDNINWNTVSDNFYDMFNVIEITKLFNDIDMTSFEFVSDPTAASAIKTTI